MVKTIVPEILSVYSSPITSRSKDKNYLLPEQTREKD